MKKALFFSFLLAISGLPGLAQKSEKQKSSPDEEIKVRREYDKDGNLIRFDSLRVFKWSGDSLFRFSPDGGWADFFGKEFPFNQFGMDSPGDSLLSFKSPKGFPSFRFFGEDDFLKKFGSDADSSFFRDFMFLDDSSFFIGPHSSLMLPPGFFAPGQQGFRDLEHFFGQDFESLFPDRFFNPPGKDLPEEDLFSPRQREEWEKMMRRHQQEQEEFFKRWNQSKPGKKFEKM
jgi:hypothetical protein